MIDVKQEVIRQLDQVYPDIPVYAENIEQGFEIPCFFVSKISDNYKKIQGSRYQMRPCFDIHYFADNNKKLQAMEFKLYRSMGMLLGKMIRGRNMHGEIIDDVLHFFVEYPHQYHEIEIYEKMQNCEVKSSGKKK